MFQHCEHLVPKIISSQLVLIDLLISPAHFPIQVINAIIAVKLASCP